MLRLGTEDAPEMGRLHARAFEAAWPGEAFLALLASPGVEAIGDDGRRGFLVLRVAADDAEILTLAVDPAHRRRGVGMDLVHAACAAARAAGAGRLTLEAASDNTAALDLYRSCGFEVVGRRRGYYRRAGGEVDAVVLAAMLSAAP